jgi:hypothetical protein
MGKKLGQILPLALFVSEALTLASQITQPKGRGTSIATM